MNYIFFFWCVLDQFFHAATLQDSAFPLFPCSLHIRASTVKAVYPVDNGGEPRDGQPSSSKLTTNGNRPFFPLAVVPGHICAAGVDSLVSFGSTPSRSFAPIASAGPDFLFRTSRLSFQNAENSWCLPMLGGFSSQQKNRDSMCRSLEALRTETCSATLSY